MTKNTKKYMRKEFIDEIHQIMKEDKDVYFLTGDLGFGYLDKIKEDFPDRFINVGASEQTMIGMAVGLALEGKIPFVYSITTFLINRPFEWIRNYINHEKIQVKLVGVGRDKEYEHDEFSHFATDSQSILNLFENILQYWPDDGEGARLAARSMYANKLPSFVSLRR